MVYMLTFGGILMGSMLPYMAAPWIIWVVGVRVRAVSTVAF